MRTLKTVPLGNDKSVLVSELRVRDARNIMTKAKALQEADIKSLLTERFDELVDLLGDCIQLPAEMAFDDLSFSELESVKDALMEVNQAFLNLVGMTGLLETLSPPLTEAAPSLLNEDTRESQTTDGSSSSG